MRELAGPVCVTLSCVAGNDRTCRWGLAKIPDPAGKSRKFPARARRSRGKHRASEVGKFQRSRNCGLGNFPKARFRGVALNEDYLAQTSAEGTDCRAHISEEGDWSSHGAQGAQELAAAAEPRKAAYNRGYNRTAHGCLVLYLAASAWAVARAASLTLSLLRRRGVLMGIVGHQFEGASITLLVFRQPDRIAINTEERTQRLVQELSVLAVLSTSAW